MKVVEYIERMSSAIKAVKVKAKRNHVGKLSMLKRDKNAIAVNIVESWKVNPHMIPSLAEYNRVENCLEAEHKAVNDEVDSEVNKLIPNNTMFEVIQSLEDKDIPKQK